MKRRMYYTLRNGYAPMRYVLLIQPDAHGDVSVYCPPGVAGGPWVELFSTREQALDIASNLAQELGQIRVKSTQYKVDWRLNGLDLIGDSDEKYRREHGGGGKDFA